MNEQQRLEIGDRLRELRDNSPETNRSIADYVGMAERTVAGWAAGSQGITYDNAQKVAELFEVDLDWFWRGRKEKPDDGRSPLDALSKSGDLPAEVSEAVEALRVELVATRTQLLAEIAKVQELQAAQQPKKERPSKRSKGNRK